MEMKNKLMEEYLTKILEKNEYLNLTRITNLQQAKKLHIEDSLSALPEMNSAPEGLYGDLGSGGGFPGVPLAIQTNRETILVDSVQKKMKAVNELIEELNLNNISTYSGRIEDLAKEKSGEFAVLTARALSSLPSLLELASPLLKKGGHLICMKANIDDDELKRGEELSEDLGLKKISSRSFYLSDNETYRTIIVFEKIGKEKIQLPRRVGLAQKKPLR